jgi:hypothetical protein
VSPTNTARHRQTLRKVAIYGSALVVAVLPTACGAAYADSDLHSGHDVVDVGAAAPDEGGEAAAPENGGEAAAPEEGGAPAAPEDGGVPATPDDRGGAPAPDDGGEAAEGAGGDAKAGVGEAEVRRGKVDKPEPGNGNGNGNGNGDNGLDVLGQDCSNSNLEPHDGFEEGPRCVDTAFGEVGTAENNPSLLITESPDAVGVDQEFTITVSTRNLVRDRFLGAADGGYYLESSFLDEAGIQRGHFHTACRMLESTDAAPDPAPEPEFFLATQDNGGGAAPDTVEITVSGMPQAGTAQCAVWAGDGSHRTPMMQRANQTPAFDAVRINVQ